MVRIREVRKMECMMSKGDLQQIVLRYSIHVSFKERGENLIAPTLDVPTIKTYPGLLKTSMNLPPVGDFFLKKSQLRVHVKVGAPGAFSTGENHAVMVVEALSLSTTSESDT